MSSLSFYSNTGVILSLVCIWTTAPALNGLTMEDAIARAELNAPVLQASEAGIESSQRLVEQAGRWGNPSFSVEAENFGGSGSFDGTDAAEYTVLLEQPIELGGKRRARRDLAAADLEEARLLADMALEELQAEVRRRFTRCLQARERLSQAKSLEQAAQSAADAVQIQKGVGAAAGLDDRRTRVALSLARIEVDRAGRDYDEARELLASLWDGNADFEAEGELQAPGNLPESAVLEDLLHDSVRWELAGLPAERQRRALELARSSAWPDMALGVGHRWFEEDDAEAWVAGLTLSIPVFDRNQGNIEAATTTVRRTNAEVETRHRELRESLRSITASLRRSHEAASRLSDEALPLARETRELVAEGYRLGRYDLLYLLDAQKTLSEVERQWIDALAEFQLAVADLQSLVGDLPPSLAY